MVCDDCCATLVMCDMVCINREVQPAVLAFKPKYVYVLTARYLGPIRTRRRFVDVTVTLDFPYLDRNDVRAGQPLSPFAI
jgi:hypothetical protein